MTASDYKNVNFGPKLLMASAATDIYAAAFYVASNNVSIPGPSSSPAGQPAFCLGQDGKFYFVVDRGDWTIYSFDASSKDPLTEVATLDSTAMAEVNGIEVDANGVIYLLKRSATDCVMKLSAAGAVVWGPHSINFSGDTGEAAVGIKLFGERLFVYGGGTNYPFCFECDTTDSTVNAIGARLGVHISDTGYVFSRMGGIIIDSTNSDIALVAAKSATVDLNVKVFDIDETSTTEVNNFRIDTSTDTFNTWEQGQFVHYDVLNDQGVFCFETSGGKSVMQTELSTDVINGQKECTTIGDLLDSCVDSAGNIYMLFTNNEIVCMDDSLTVLWQSQVTSVDATLHVRAIRADAATGLLGILMMIDQGFDYTIFATVPLASGEGSFDFANPSNAPNTITVASMTADTWASPSWTLASNTATVVSSGTLALNDDTDGTLDNPSTVLTELVTG